MSKPIPAHLVAVCTECDKDIALGERMICRDCETAAEECAFDEGRYQAENERENNPDLIREWAQRRFVMGQISRELRDELELCAADIEVGHG